MNKPIDVTGVVLHTDRLTLRPWRESDLADFNAYARVDGVGQMAGWMPHRSLGESREILQRFIEERKTFALEYEGRAVGSLGVEHYAEMEFPELAGLWGREIGYVLSKELWGQGLMPEAVRAVLRWLFDAEGLDFAVVGHFEHNGRSAGVIRKCGFRYVKTVPVETRCGTVELTRLYILYNPARQGPE